MILMKHYIKMLYYKSNTKMQIVLGFSLFEIGIHYVAQVHYVAQCWPETLRYSCPASKVLGLQICDTMPGKSLTIFLFLFWGSEGGEAGVGFELRALHLQRRCSTA
jgi:hypothetical protein